VLDLVEHFRGSGIIVRFIEYMDVGNRNDWNRERVVPSQQLL
jgi:cyclic pyranopterin phosphate synthase